MKYFFIITILVLFSITACQSTDNSKAETIESLSIKIENEPNNISLLEQRKKLFLEQQNYQRAIADLQHCINLTPDSSKYYIELAGLFMEKGNINNTLGLLEKASKIDPLNPKIWNNVAEIYLLYKKYPDVIKFANKSLEVDPYNAKAFFIKGYAFMESENKQEAIHNFLECLKNDPNNYNANMELGALYFETKNDLAITYYKNAITIDSNKINAYYNLGLYYQNNDYLNEAIDTYKDIIAKDSLFPNSYYNIGYIYLELLKVTDMAVPYFSKSINVKPDYKEAYFNRALCFEEVGNIMQAQVDYKKALEIDPNYQLAIEALNRVEQTIYSN